jgi:hypothetical protein
MKFKNEAFEKFKESQNEVENQLNKEIKALRPDRCGEHLSNESNGTLWGFAILSVIILLNLFVGYLKEIRGYPHENKVFVARDAVFLEKEFSSRQSGRKFELDEVQKPQTENEVEENVSSSSSAVIIPLGPRRSSVTFRK